MKQRSYISGIDRKKEMHSRCREKLNLGWTIVSSKFEYTTVKTFHTYEGSTRARTKRRFTGMEDMLKYYVVFEREEQPPQAQKDD